MLEKCGVCKGMGKVYMIRPTTGPNGIEICTNCVGNGKIWSFGIFSITFKRSDELPKVIWRG